MNTRTILTALFVFCTLSFYGQAIPGKKVPKPVWDSFRAKFGTDNLSNISWEMEDDTAYEAEFAFKGKNTSALFHKDGKWIETETDIKIGEIPANITTVLSRKFAGYVPVEACQLNHYQYGNCYEVEVKGPDRMELLFSEAGRILKRTVNNDAEDDDEKDERE